MRETGASLGTPRALPVRAVLFDLDGTLADTAADLAAALNRVRADRRLPPLPVATLRPHASDGTRGMLGAGLGVTREHRDWDILKDAFLDYYAAAIAVHTRLFTGAEDVIHNNPGCVAEPAHHPPMFHTETPVTVMLPFKAVRMNAVRR